MRLFDAALLISSFVTVGLLSSCADEAIGQPCTFSWPVADFGGDLKTDCNDLPRCHPLEEDTIGTNPERDACPVDCIQLPSLECTNLICVATQVDEGPDAYMHVNGRCASDVPRTECQGAAGASEEGSAAYGCSGYCTKECLSDASCPKGYRCAPMAPFGENLNCNDEAQWGDNCTDSCTDAGADPGTGVTCPASGSDVDYTVCDYGDYSKCCSCICYRFCPLLTKKFCRKVQWDESMFSDGVVNSAAASQCQQAN